MVIPAILITAGFVLGCGDDDDGDGIGDIVPGEKIEPIKLGDTYEEVKSKLGQDPDEDECFGDGCTLVYLDKGIVAYTLFGDVWAVDAIPNYKGKTAGGVGIDSTEAEVIDEFGEPEEIVDVYFYAYWTQGIGFVIEHTVNVIDVFEPILD